MERIDGLMRNHIVLDIHDENLERSRAVLMSSFRDINHSRLSKCKDQMVEFWKKDKHFDLLEWENKDI